LTELRNYGIFGINGIGGFGKRQEAFLMGLIRFKMISKAGTSDSFLTIPLNHLNPIKTPPSPSPIPLIP
jgi:hypothetical protein